MFKKTLTTNNVENMLFSEFFENDWNSKFRLEKSKHKIIKIHEIRFFIMSYSTVLTTYHIMWHIILEAFHRHMSESHKKCVYRHISSSIKEICWLKVNKCWLFTSLSTFMSENIPELSPDAKSCLEQKIHRFEVDRFLRFGNFWKSARDTFWRKG